MNWQHSGVKKPEDVQVKHLMICAKCHLPQLADATDVVAKEIVQNVIKYSKKNATAEEAESSEKQPTKISINCLVCHQRNAITNKWVDSFSQKNKVIGSKDGAHDDKAHPTMKKSPIMNESILCGQCHGLGPNFELGNPSQCGTLYGSYLYTNRRGL